MIKVYRYRVKNLEGHLNKQANGVNFVWNYCNESQKSAFRLGKKWLSGFDLINLTSGTSKELGIHSGTVESICQQYAQRRREKKRPFLRWRTTKSLGWIPLKGRYIKRTTEGFKIDGRAFKLFYSRPIPDCALIRDGSNFSQDAKGNWFLNIVLKLPDTPTKTPHKAIGIDLGIKDFAALSNGEKIENPRHLAQFADKLAMAHKARKKRQAVNIYANIKNTRRDFHHKLSSRIANEFDYIAVGNVSGSDLAKTKMAKSVLDAGWTSFRDMLRYKAIGLGAIFEEVNESYSTRVCSSCGSMTGPKGVAELGIRTWDCLECGARHDRDHNSAKNILFGSGHRALVEGARL